MIRNQIKEKFEEKAKPQEQIIEDLEDEGMFNVLTVIEEKKSILKDLKGFCPNCGATVSKINIEKFLNCSMRLGSQELIKDIEEAKVLRNKYNYVQ